MDKFARIWNLILTLMMPYADAYALAWVASAPPHVTAFPSLAALLFHFAVFCSCAALAYVRVYWLAPRKAAN